MDTLVLRAVARELDLLIGGRRVRRAGLRNERELGLVLAGEPDPGMLVLAVAPGIPHLRLEPTRPLSRRLTDQLGEAAPLLAGARVIGAEATGFERVLHLALEAHPGRQAAGSVPAAGARSAEGTGSAEGTRPAEGAPPASIDLYFELLPRTPFLVVTSGGKIVAAVRAPGTSRPDDRRMERGGPYVLPFGLGSPASQPPVGEVIAATLDGLEDRERWADAMASLHRGVSPEVLSRLLDGARDVAEAAARLAAYRGPVLIERDREGAPELRAGAPGDPLVAPAAGTEPSPSPALDAMAEWARLRLAHERTVALRSQIARGLRAEREKVRRATRRLARDRSKIGDAAAQRRCGEALLANLGEVPRGASAVVVRNPYGDPEEIEIEIDPRRSPAANAEAYFRSARRAERAAEHLAARERALAERDRELARGLERLDDCDDDALPALLLDLARSGLVAADPAAAATPPADVRKAEGPRAPRNRERAVRLPYRSYDLGGGWEAWVGRSNTDNDVLTHRLARPHDHWFHVHGASGSHVILRRSDGARGEPPASVIQAAAACAAFFSRARHSRLVPVIVAEKRYVRKPRGSPPGTAACLRERTMMVEPVRPAAGELYGRKETMRAESGEETKEQRRSKGDRAKEGEAKQGKAKQSKAKNSTRR